MKKAWMIASLAILAGAGWTLAQTPGGAPGGEVPEPDWFKGKTFYPTYSEGVALVYEHRCNHCHRPGEIAPMSFRTHADIRKWSVTTSTPMKTVITTRAMPPWPADTSVGKFANDPRLSQGEIDLLVAWIDDGYPRGDDVYESPIEWVDGWAIGEPDAVFALPDYTVGEDVDGEYKEFTIETDFGEDRWIVAAEARPGDQFLVTAIDGGPLGSYHAGNTNVRHQPGTARLLEAGASVTVRVHYLKEKGYELTDSGGKLGVVFAEGGGDFKAIHEAEMTAPEFTLPAGAADFQVTARHTFERDAHIVSLMPILRMRGKSVAIVATTPDGAEHALLSIPEWDPQWNFRYQLAEPLAAPAGTIVEARLSYDNSAENIRNPDPSIDVPHGPGGETFQGWVGYTLDGAN